MSQRQHPINAYNEFVSDEPYSSEDNLIQTVLQESNLRLFLPKNAESEPLATRELPIGMGVADIVLGAANLPHLVARLKRQHMIPSEIKGIEAVILSYLYVHRRFSAETVARRSGLDLSTTRRALTNLVEWELCSKPTSTTYLRNPISEHIYYLVSIEGKLTNWRKALEQASRNRLFAAYSYVVLDSRRAKGALENLDLFKAHGIGLAVARAHTQSVKIICRPVPPHRPVSNVFSVIAKEALTARILEKDIILSESAKNALSARH